MISAQIRARVRERAQNACEYCHLPQADSPLAALHVEHIIPKIHGGSDDLDNLALACIDCNLHKGTNLTGIDPETNAVTELIQSATASLGRAFRVAGNPFERQDCNGQDYGPSAEC
jgi:5-methylcytosine-specific restriction endonuclease McrA